MTEPTPTDLPADRPMDPAKVLPDLLDALEKMGVVLIQQHQLLTAMGVQQSELMSIVHQYQPLLEAASAGPLARGLGRLRRPGTVEVH